MARAMIPVPETLGDVVGVLQNAENVAGLTLDRRVLRRFERKYGPQSAKLNGLETLAAYLLQRSPGFGVTKDGPGPFEAILSYSAAYVTRNEEGMRLVSVAEFGLRTYIFADGWGSEAGQLSFLRPGYVSYGMDVWAMRLWLSVRSGQRRSVRFASRRSVRSG